MADGIDLKEFRKLTKDLKEFKPDKQVKKALKMAGELIAADARALVEPHSKTVPPTIKVRIRKTSITVQAGGENVPIAGLLEMGNKGRGKGDTFRHPVYGTDTWVNQPMHPYLLKATQKNTRAIEAFEGQIVAEAFKEVGWHGA